MAGAASDELGTWPIGKLLVKQAIPAAIGILVMSLNILVDSIFVGKWIGPMAIAAINVVLPVSFFIGALGIAIGVGGSSIISRALGSGDRTKAVSVFGNQIALTISITVILVVVGLSYRDVLIPAFGGKGGIFDLAKTYYTIILYGVPFLALCMMGNTVIRAEGKPRFAMIAMIVPSVGNLLMDYVFIYLFDWGMEGAAWASTVGYLSCFLYVAYFFFSKNTEIKGWWRAIGFQWNIVKEISALGSVTLARQAVTSVNYLILNNVLFDLGGEALVAVYAIIGRMLMFALFPVFGVTQGFLPIAGYNYGAKKYERVKKSIYTAIKYATLIGTLVFLGLMVFPDFMVNLFLSDKANLPQSILEVNAYVRQYGPNALRWVFAATPIIALQLIGSAYFQAVGKAIPAFLLTLSRQGFFFIPLVLVLPHYYGTLGVWLSFPLADLLATIVTGIALKREMKRLG